MSCKARPATLIAAAVLLLGGCKSSPAPRTSAPGTQPAATATPAVARPTAAATSAASPLARPAVTVVAVAGTPGQVTITAAGANPATIAIQAGRAVTWLNGDAMPHRIVSDEPGLFDTGDIAPGASATVTLAATGLHDWHDLRTGALRGTVRVLP